MQIDTSGPESKMTCARQIARTADYFAADFIAIASETCALESSAHSLEDIVARYGSRRPIGAF